jgi:Autotransporter beta-domain
MRSFSWLAIACLMAAEPAQAADSGLQIGMRGAISAPFGNVESGTPLDAVVSSFLPVSTEIGYRFDGHFYAGVYGEYGFVNTSCPSGLDGTCSSHSLGFGLEGRYHFLPGRTLNPWVGLALGYEALSMSQNGANDTLTATASGLLLRAEFGVDLFAIPRLAIGLFVSASAGDFLTETVNSHGEGDFSHSVDGGTHAYLQAGVRVTFLP